MEKLGKTAEKNKNSNTKTTDKTTPSRQDSLEKVTDNLTFYSNYQEKVGKKLTKIMDELDLIMEDLKGIEVDKNI